MRRGAKPAKTKAEAKLPVARKSLKNDGSRVGDLEKRLAEALKREAEALEQQTATSQHSADHCELAGRYPARVRYNPGQRHAPVRGGARGPVSPFDGDSLPRGSR